MSCNKCKPSNDDHTSEDLINLCSDLNDKYFKEYFFDSDWNSQRFGWIGFTYENCEYAEAITICGDIVLWQSENDPREFCKECDDYHRPSIREHVEQEYVKFVKMLSTGIIESKNE